MPENYLQRPRSFSPAQEINVNVKWFFGITAGIIIVFVGITAFCLYLPKLRMKYYVNKYHSSKSEEKVLAVDYFVSCEDKGIKILTKLLKSREKAELLSKSWEHVNDYEYYYKNGGGLNSPLDEACIEQYVDVVELFLMKGADPNTIEKTGMIIVRPYDPIFTACFNGDLDFVKLLVEYGAKINIMDDDGYTPLTTNIFVSDEKDCKIVKYLVEHGADINVKNNDRETPLLFAIIADKKDVFYWLLKHGGNVKYIL